MKRIIIACLLLSATLYAQDSEPTHLINFLKNNSSHTDYATSYFGDEFLVYSTPTTTKGKNPKSDLFLGKIDEAGTAIDPKIIGFENRTVIKTGLTLSIDHKTIYFSAKNRRKGKEQLFRATIDDDGLWTNIMRLPFNDTRHDYSAPTLSPDNTKLYFVSNNRQSYGGSDIFVVTIKEDGEFEEPVNLGNLINTSSDEITPFVSTDNVLYYSSNGLQDTQGGFDVYQSQISEDGFTAPEGLGAPINGLHNDFAYIINSVNSKGYFTSNRLQGDETNNMYSFIIENPINENCEQVIAGIVNDKETSAPIAGAEMILYDDNQVEVSKLTTDETGAYSFTMACNTTYTLIATGESYDKEEHIINTANYKNAPALAANKFLTKTIGAVDAIASNGTTENAAENGTDLAGSNTNTDDLKQANIDNMNTQEELTKREFNTYTPVAELPEVNSIYFDFDKSYIKQAAHPQLDEIVTIMKENPEVSIELSAYTDSRGPKIYNLDLSQRRLKSTMRYLVDHGIDNARLSGEGYGEDNITNQCTDGVPCSREDHKKNRRTEFNFILNNAVVQLRKKEKIIEETKEESFVKPQANPLPKQAEIAAVIPTKKVVAPVQKEIPDPIKIVEKPAEKIVVKSIDIEDDIEVSSAVSEEKIKTLLAEGLIVESTTNINADPTQPVQKTERKIKAIPFQTVAEPKPATPAIPATPKVADEKNKLEAATTEQTKTDTATYARLEEMRENKEKLLIQQASNTTEQKIVKSTNLVANASDNDTFEPNDMLKIVKKNAIQQQESPKLTPKEEATVPEITPEASAPPVNINAVSVTPMTSKRGKYVSTDRAKKIQALRVNFRLMSDPTNPSGYQNAYIVIQSPDGKVINQTGTFELASGEPMGFTDQTTVLFENHDIKVVMFIDRIIQKFVKGVYKVDIYFNGTLSSSSNLAIAG